MTLKLKVNLFTVLFACYFFANIPSSLAFTINVKNSSGEAISNVALILKSNTSTNTDPNQLSGQNILQRDFMFEPRISIITKGEKVNFPNFDQTHHSVYSFSKAAKFEFPLYQGQSPEIVFDKAGIISVGCNIHDWMLAYIVVADSPYYALSNKQGVADIENVPEGQYTVLYWHPNMPPEAGVKQYQQIQVTKNGQTSINLQINNAVNWPEKPAHLR